jgi:hypothetical protein
MTGDIGPEQGRVDLKEIPMGTYVHLVNKGEAAKIDNDSAEGAAYEFTDRKIEGTGIEVGLGVFAFKPGENKSLSTFLLTSEGIKRIGKDVIAKTEDVSRLDLFSHGEPDSSKLQVDVSLDGQTSLTNSVFTDGMATDWINNSRQVEKNVSIPSLDRDFIEGLYFKFSMTQGGDVN